MRPTGSGGFIPPPPPGPAPLSGSVPADDIDDELSSALRDPPFGAQISFPDATVVRLVVLRGPVVEGTAFDLPEGRVTIGRAGDLAMSADALMAPRHVALERFGDHVQLTDVLGPGGCFLRIREPATVLSGEVVFAGEQYLMIRTGQDVPSDPVGAYAPPETFGTPLPAPQMHVTQLLAGGLPGRVVSTDRDVLTVGREGCDLSFPQDRFMSGRHLRLDMRPDGHLQLQDVGSLNGTFVRVTDLPQTLQKGDELLVGSTLLRLEIKPADGV